MCQYNLVSRLHVIGSHQRDFFIMWEPSNSKLNCYINVDIDFRYFVHRLKSGAKNLANKIVDKRDFG